MGLEKKRKYHGFIGLGVFALAEFSMLAGIWPFTSWFFSLTWWAYIFMVDHFVYHLKGKSLWVNHRAEFFLLIPCSVVFWMIFEGFNVYLGNWQYENIHSQTWVRWIGYFISFGTVLPALFETRELIESLGTFRSLKIKPLPFPASWHLPFTVLGLLFLFLPLFWPGYFFALTWLGFFFLFEPILHAKGGRSLMRDLEQGHLQTIISLLVSGLICGIFWEFLNYWATAKWVYTVPYVSWLKIFEMPVLGFFGFLPFAVESFVMYNFLCLLRQGGDANHVETRQFHLNLPAFWVSCLVLAIMVFTLVSRSIDFYTVRSFLELQY